MIADIHFPENQALVILSRWHEKKLIYETAMNIALTQMTCPDNSTL